MRLEATVKHMSDMEVVKRVLNSFTNRVEVACTSKSANFVLLKCIEHAPFSQVGFVMEEVLEGWPYRSNSQRLPLLRVANHVSGCRVMKAICSQSSSSDWDFRFFADLMKRVRNHLDVQRQDSESARFRDAGKRFPHDAGRTRCQHRCESHHHVQRVPDVIRLCEEWRSKTHPEHCMNQSGMFRLPDDMDMFRRLENEAKVEAVFGIGQHDRSDSLASAQSTAPEVMKILVDLIERCMAASPPRCSSLRASLLASCSYHQRDGQFHHHDISLPLASPPLAPEPVCESTTDPGRSQPSSGESFIKFKTALLDNFEDLMEPVGYNEKKNFGNFVFQQMIENAHPALRQEIAVVILGDPLRWAKHIWGSYVIKSLVAVVTDSDMDSYAVPCLHHRVYQEIASNNVGDQPIIASPCLQLVCWLLIEASGLKRSMAASHFVKFLQKDLVKRGSSWPCHTFVKALIPNLI